VVVVELAAAAAASAALNSPCCFAESSGMQMADYRSADSRLLGGGKPCREKGQSVLSVTCRVTSLLHVPWSPYRWSDELFLEGTYRKISTTDFVCSMAGDFCRFMREYGLVSSRNDFISNCI
jgi:hypothetical protein